MLYVDAFHKPFEPNSYRLMLDVMRTLMDVTRTRTDAMKAIERDSEDCCDHVQNDNNDADG